ncbi:MAG: hypothetical protein ACI84C_000779 [Flavobacteriales bacterium]|jgi:hypothetical protein
MIAICVQKAGLLTQVKCNVDLCYRMLTGG